MVERQLLPSDDFPLPHDQSLSPEEVVAGIGTFTRQFRTRIEGKSDFPQPVAVATRDRREVLAHLLGLYADGASQVDGTFYFDREVRIHQGTRATNFLWGREIAAITFLSDGMRVPEVLEEK